MIDFSKFVGKTIRTISYDNADRSDDSVEIVFDDGDSITITSFGTSEGYGSLGVYVADEHHV